MLTRSRKYILYYLLNSACVTPVFLKQDRIDQQEVFSNVVFGFTYEEIVLPLYQTLAKLHEYCIVKQTTYSICIMSSPTSNW